MKTTKKARVDTIDDLIADLEARGLGWSLDHAGHMIEARIWDWPHVIGRYRPAVVEPLEKMLLEAMLQVNWRKYPPKTRRKRTYRPAHV